MTRTHWQIRLGAEAEKDFAHILKHAKDNFGERQFEIYQAPCSKDLPCSRMDLTFRAAPHVMKF